MGEPAEDARSGEERTLERMHSASDALWGPERTRANEAVLKRTAYAVHRMSLLSMRPEEPPGFFLSEFSDAEPGSALGLDRPRD